MMVLGVDPGNAGALALVQTDGVLLHIWDMPVVREKKHTFLSRPLLKKVMREIWTFTNEWRVGSHHEMPVAYLEKVGARPGQGVTSMFNFGRSVGLLEGFLAAYGCRVEEAPPNVWKAQMRLTGKQKDASRYLALERFPHNPELFELKKHEGRAEAALIALWGLQQEKRRQ